MLSGIFTDLVTDDEGNEWVNVETDSTGVVFSLTREQAHDLGERLIARAGS